MLREKFEHVAHTLTLAQEFVINRVSRVSDTTVLATELSACGIVLQNNSILHVTLLIGNHKLGAF